MNKIISVGLLSWRTFCGLTVEHNIAVSCNDGNNSKSSVPQSYVSRRAGDDYGVF